MAVYTLFNANTRKKETVTLGSDAEALRWLRTETARNAASPGEPMMNTDTESLGCFRTTKAGTLRELGAHKYGSA